MADERRKFRNLGNSLGSAADCVVATNGVGTQQEGWGGGCPCFVATQELWTSSLCSVMSQVPSQGPCRRAGIGFMFCNQATLIPFCRN